MPRAFTPQERDQIRERLRKVARKSLVRRGIRGTSVGQLTRAAGIAKGSFYLFYSSKEALVLDLVAEVEVDLRKELQEIVLAEGLRPKERLERLVRHFFEVFERHSVLALLADPDEAATLLRGLPTEVLAERKKDDDRFFRQLYEDLRLKGCLAEVDPEAFVAVPRAAMALSQQRELIGDSFPHFVDLLVESLADRLSPGSEPQPSG